MAHKRIYRPVIAINDETHEVVRYSGAYSAGKDLGITPAAVSISIAMRTLARGWRLYDEPAKIKESIAEMQEDLKVLESYGIK